MPRRVFESRVDFIYPTVSSETRTLKLRLSLANPDRALKPGMFGNVRVTHAAARGLAVPAEAVVHSGDSDYVFRIRNGDQYEPRPVEVGAQDGEWVHVVRGLAAGDTVVASASFLIDSESRLKAAIAGMGSQPHGDHGK
jgi:Cu(I)/Ag(I) efflux system membrane fusion protein